MRKTVKNSTGVTEIVGKRSEKMTQLNTFSPRGSEVASLKSQRACHIISTANGIISRCHFTTELGQHSNFSTDVRPQAFS